MDALGVTVFMFVFATRALGAAVIVFLVTAAAGVMFVAAPAHGALPDTSTPELRLNHTLRTSPFVGSSVSMKDLEGSANVARDGSLWLGDDDGRMIYEVDPTTGVLKRTIDRTAFAAVPRFGGGSLAGADRARDIESLAYDAAADVLYVFSGSCCSSSVLPTVFRLTRQSGLLQLESYQPLASGSDFTAAGWNAADGKVYVGVSSNLRSYDYPTNTAGSTFQIPNLSGILGLTFSDDGADLYVARKPATLSRVNWSTKRLVSGWTFDLTPYGMKDARAVDLIADQVWVSDGYDNRASSDPLRHAVFVFDVVGSTPTPAAPTASFNATPTTGTAPLTVSFTDTSTGAPTSWLWDFGDGGTSTAQNPSNLYSAPGTFTVTLTAFNANGSSTASQPITVSATPPPPPPSGDLVGNPDFETSTSGWDTGGYTAVTLERVSGGHSGSWSAKLTNTGSTSVTTTLNDAPNWVQTSQAGTYTGSLWVRSDTAGAKVYLRLREYQGSTKVAEKLVGVTLSTSWQQVTGTLTPVAPGNSTIDFSAAVYSAPAGSSLYADDAHLSLS